MKGKEGDEDGRYERKDGWREEAINKNSRNFQRFSIY